MSPAQLRTRVFDIDKYTLLTTDSSQPNTCESMSSARSEASSEALSTRRQRIEQLGEGPKEHKLELGEESKGRKSDSKPKAAAATTTTTTTTTTSTNAPGMEYIEAPPPRKPKADDTMTSDKSDKDRQSHVLLGPPTPGPHGRMQQAGTSQSVEERIMSDLESQGYRRVEGRSMEGHEEKHGKHEKHGKNQLPQVSKGERVMIVRMEEGEKEGKGGLTEVEVRPSHEVGAVSATEGAEIIAREHALLAEESRRRAEEKHAELLKLRQQAEQLEKQSAALLEEAEAERRRVENALRRKESIEHEEWRGYSEAEKAEAKRREVVEKAKPAAKTAESLEKEALYLRQGAADSEFHAQVLENRAKALLKESEEMADVSVYKSTEARKISAQLTIARQEADELKLQISMQAARGLPDYIQECQREIGALTHRIAQLREEIAWAEDEMGRARGEADTWRRILVSKEASAARLLLELTQLQHDAEEARTRSRKAAEEAHEPTELAEKKYNEAWDAFQKARNMEEDAKAAQAEALEAVKAAFEPEQERQRALREAAAAEAVAKTIETRVDVIRGKVDRRQYEADVAAETAVSKTEEANRREEEYAMEKEKADAERHMAEKIKEQSEGYKKLEVPAI